jgi:hypothetical protein
MMVKYLSIRWNRENLDYQSRKPTNARLYQCVPGKTKIKAINELEYINGKFYANVWQKMPLQLLILKLELLKEY